MAGPAGGLPFLAWRSPCSHAAGKQQLRELLAHSQEGESVLRLTVEAGGCSGFSYKFDLEKGARSDDRSGMLCVESAATES